MLRLVLCAPCAPLLSACATPEAAPAGERAEGHTLTGSNIVRRHRDASPAPVVTGSREAVADLQRNPSGATSTIGN